MLSCKLRALALLLVSLNLVAALPQPQPQDDNPNLPPEYSDDAQDEIAIIEGLDEAVEEVLFVDPSPNVSPVPPMFTVDLNIPKIKEPYLKVTNPVTGKEIWYYEFTIKTFTQKIYPNLAATTFTGYDGQSPGPTMKVPRGTETVVRFVNQATRKSAIHLHGSPSRAPFDGWAEDTISPGQYKDYYFPNSQSARMLWYHDHAMGITSLNSNSGQAGAYIIEDSAENGLNLPSGKYDIPLIIQAKRFNSDGSLYDISGDLAVGNSLWGDVITVNGTPFPKLNVEPKRYRFRILNASVSRAYGLYFSQITNNGPSEVPYTVIGSDAGLLVDTATVTLMYCAMAERWEIIFDFSSYASQTIQMRNRPLGNDGVGAEVDYQNTHMIMNFVVSAMTSRTVDDSEVRVRMPVEGETEEKRSEEEVTTALATRASGELAKRNWVVDHVFRFTRTTDGVWNINGVTFDDVANRILANVPKGTKQIWQLDNRDNAWTHPVHVHLVDFQVIHREGGRGFVQIYELRGLKDVVWLARDEMVLVEATYNPWPGVYMFHCHNLIHEDHDMMAAFNVTVLPGMGYDDDHFMDPMESAYRAKAYSASDYSGRAGSFSDANIKKGVETLARANPYHL